MVDNSSIKSMVTVKSNLCLMSVFLLLLISMSLGAVAEVTAQSSGYTDYNELGGQEIDKTDAELMAAEKALLLKFRGAAKGQDTLLDDSNSHEAHASSKTAADPTSKVGKIKRVEGNSSWNDVMASFKRAQAENNLRVQALMKENRELKKKLSEMKTSVQELKQAKNRLMVAETEIKRLERILVSRDQARIGSLKELGSAKQLPVKSASKAKYSEQEEMPIVTVTVDKANLRAGPGKHHSILMEVNKGTRLAVETRQGEWYRITSPTGKRAWVSAKVVTFGPDDLSSPSRIVKVKGYDASLEDRAFELIRNHSK